MKANTRRGARLAFDDVAAVYDQARPRIPEHLVTTLVEITGLGLGDPVLEVGAGTGQLTLPLRAAGLRITAVEPGKRMRDLLSRHVAADDGVTVLGGLFEDYQGPDAAFSAVVSANAWQWINPDVSYSKAAGMLREGGHLALIWNFPIVADPLLQEDLNARTFADHPDAVRNPATHLPEVKARAAEGRGELAASGLYEPPWWQLSTDTLTVSPDAYIALLVSYANAATLTPDSRASLEHGVRMVLADHGTKTVPLLNHFYLCVARRRAACR